MTNGGGRWAVAVGGGCLALTAAVLSSVWLAVGTAVGDMLDMEVTLTSTQAVDQ
jgi:hypothetical protein